MKYSQSLIKSRRYPVSLEFSSNYPDKAPIAKFPPGFFHLNGASNLVFCLCNSTSLLAKNFSQPLSQPLGIECEARKTGLDSCKGISA